MLVHDAGILDARANAQVERLRKEIKEGEEKLAKTKEEVPSFSHNYDRDDAFAGERRLRTEISRPGGKGEARYDRKRANDAEQLSGHIRARLVTGQS